ncbi:competence type IV pilus minor pilin ComGD [Bacillus sp. N9]
MERFKKSNQQDGFTLVEMLIVISVLTILLSFSLFSFKHFSDWMQRELFITQLQSDLYYAQAYAINRKESVHVKFLKKENQYEAVAQSGELLLNRKIRAPIYISELSVVRYTITPEGTVSHFGTVTFKHQEHTIQLTFYIGRGGSMLNNEKGIAFLEGILAFSMIVLLAFALIPVLYSMLANIGEGKKK